MRFQEDIRNIILACLSREIVPEWEQRLRLYLSEHLLYCNEYEEICAIGYAARWGGKQNLINCKKVWN